MKKKGILLIPALLVFFIQASWADSADSFKFPKQIEFKLLQNDRVMGECTLSYVPTSRKKTNNKKLSGLILENFGGFGFRSEVKLMSYIFKDNFAAYLDSVMSGTEEISQMRLKKGIGFDGKKGDVFLYLEKGIGNMQTEIYTEYKPITFLSSFFIASWRVANGEHKKSELFNLLIDKSTRIVEMRYGGQEKIPFAGTGTDVKAETILLTNPNNINKEVFRIRIYKDSHGYYYPVSILYSGKNSFEIRANNILRK